MRNRWLFRVPFLAVTALAVVLAVGTECWFAWDGNPQTEPWTSYLIRLPWWLLMPLAVGFGVWLPWHLWDARRRKAQERRTGVRE
jgi:hypothetical protein